MSQREITIGITAIGLLGGLGLYLLKDSSQKKEDTDARPNPKSSTNRIEKLQRTKKVRQKQKNKITKQKNNESTQKQGIQALYRSASDINKLPAAIWTTMRSIFIQGYKREFAENEREFIERVYRGYDNQGIDRQEAVSRAFAIASKNVQDRGLIVPGTQEATALGVDWQKIYVREVGEREFHRKFLEFQMILRLSRNK